MWAKSYSVMSKLRMLIIVVSWAEKMLMPSRGNLGGGVSSRGVSTGIFVLLSTGINKV